MASQVNLIFFGKSGRVARRDRRIITWVENNYPKLKQRDEWIHKAVEAGDAEKTTKHLMARLHLLGDIVKKLEVIIHHTNGQWLAAAKRLKAAAARIVEAKKYVENPKDRQKMDALITEVKQFIEGTLRDYERRAATDVNNIRNDRARALGYKAKLGRSQLHADESGAEYKVWKLSNKADKLVGKIKKTTGKIISDADPKKHDELERDEEQLEQQVKEVGAKLREEAKSLWRVEYDDAIDIISTFEEEIKKTMDYLTILDKEGFPKDKQEDILAEIKSMQDVFHNELNQLLAEAEVALRETHI